jgi:hypothetical protein
LFLQNLALKRNGFEAFVSPSQAVKDETKAKLALFSSKEVRKTYDVKSLSFHVTETISGQKYERLTVLERPYVHG